MTSSRTRVVDVEVVRMLRNDGTRVAPPQRRPGHFVFVPDDELRTLWQGVLDRVNGWRAEHPEGAALAVVVRQARHFDVVVEQLDSAGKDPVALILGRHSESDIDLRTQHASLRHAAIIGWPKTSTSPARAIVVDLRSELGLAVTTAGEPTRTATRVSSSRALRFHVASTEVTALMAQDDEPFAVQWADQLEAQIAGALVEGDGREGSRPPRATSRQQHQHQYAWERSVVVVSLTPGARPPPISEDQLAVRCTRDAVERGVVLGRYDKCDRTTALASEENVSRVHAMVFAAHGALWVVDTASTGGTSVVSPSAGALHLGEGRRMAKLPPDARLFLAGTEAVLVVES